MGNSSTSLEAKHGTVFVDNQHWYLVRQNKIRKLSELFRESKITCDDEIVEVSGHTVLHQIVVLDRKDLFKFCTIYGAHWDKRDKLGMTALMKAAALNRQYYVEHLIKLGADKHLKDQDQKSAIDYANFYENYEVIELLQNNSE